MFKTHRLSLTASLSALLALSASVALADTTVTPGDGIPPVVVSPAFGVPLIGGIASTQYKHLGLILSDRGAAGPSVQTAIFNDPPLAWAGVNAIGGEIDLVSPVDGRFVIPSSMIDALTSMVEVEVGFAAPGTLTLYVYGADGSLLDSRVNGLDGYGPNGRDLIRITRSTADIASFRVDGNDTWGMNQITFGDLVTSGGPGGPEVPEPGTLAMLVGSGLAGGVVFLRRRK